MRRRKHPKHPLKVRQKLTASDGESLDYFGYSVAISGATALVGASQDHVGNLADAGSVSVLTRIDGRWQQTGQ